MTTRISATLEPDVAREAKSVAGRRNLSRFVNDAVALQLQRLRIARLYAELADRHGPVPEEIVREVGRIDWPR